MQNQLPYSELFFNLNRCAIRLKTEVNRVLKAEGFGDITADYWIVLSELVKTDNTPHNALAAAVEKDKAALSRILDGMAEKGFVKRIDSPTDKRSVLVSITKKGREVFEAINPIITEAIASSISSISPIETLELNRMLLQTLRLFG